MYKIAPSVLSADFWRLGEQVKEAEEAGADCLHVDVMDGVFVPNITMGPMVVDVLRKHTPLPLDVHLMIDQPWRFFEEFVEAGASSLTVHCEGAVHLWRDLENIRDLGVEVGIALNPATSLLAITHILDLVDRVLVMTVEPGFGGQAFIRQTAAKVYLLREMLGERGLPVEIAVDGGITPETAGDTAMAGATIFVAGSAIFGHSGGITKAIGGFRERLDALFGMPSRDTL